MAGIPKATSAQARLLPIERGASTGDQATDNPRKSVVARYHIDDTADAAIAEEN
jgi:hypothetical protein